MATALATPAKIAPSSQIMDSEPGSESSSPDRLTRSLSLFRNNDLQSSCSLRSEEYRQLFRLPPEEVLLQDFNCALQENILVQGHMYLFEHYICFYSNIFGFETKKVIPLQDVTAVRRAKTAGIFPNAIEIVAAEKKHFFASFLSRDEAFKLINDGWSQHGNGLKGLSDQQDFKSETNSFLNGDIPVENADNFDSSVNDLDSDERNQEMSRSEDAKLPPNHKVDNVQATAAEGLDLVEGNQDASIDSEPSSSGSVKWKYDNRNAPEVPQCFTKIAESKFPINVERFFNLFFSDDAVGFLESFHKKCGDKDLKCTSWSPYDKCGYVREKTFQHPIKIYFGAKCGGCKETQKFRVYKDRHLIIETSQEVSDVPYADYFTVEGLWDVQEAEKSDEHCVLQVYINVAFSKKTMWKGKIEQSTMEECREAYATWINIAHELLKQKNIEEREVADGTTVSALPNGQVDQVIREQLVEHSERLLGNAEPGRISDDVPEPWVNREQNGNSLDATMITSTLRPLAVKFCSFFKRHGNLQMFLVIGFSLVLLLMQLSIVVLLSRPQQVYMIPQASHLPSSTGLGGGQRVTEAMHWLEKRMHLLKDEMLVVEAQLERMRHEHVLLRAQYNDLEHLYQQQT